MTDKFIFVNDNWLWPVVFAAIILLFTFIWKEWNSFSKKRRAIKILIAFVAVLSLAMIALKPASRQSVEKGLAVLVTDGYEPAHLDSLVKKYKNLKTLNYVKGKPLRQSLDSISSLFVIGYGVAHFDLWQFEGIPANYLGIGSLRGIAKLKYDIVNTMDSELRIRGQYANPSEGNYLVLQASGGLGVDSVRMEKLPFQEFDLSTSLKVEGNFVYRLMEKDTTGGILFSESIPISVKPKELLKILFVGSFPTFETKYLKNYLAEMNHAVTVRSQLTKGTYKYEYLNTKREPIYRLSQENLKRFDILVLDTDSYKGLSQKSFLEVTNAIREDGLGLLIQSDDDFFNLPKRKSYFDFKRNESASVQLDDWPEQKIESFPFRFEDAFLLQSIHTSDGELISATKKIGRGRISTSVLKNTYQLLLDGNIAAYQKLWTEIVESVAKRKLSQFMWQPDGSIIFRHEPYDFTLRTSYASPKVINGHGSTIPLLQNPDFSNVWSGTTYPKKIGWNQLRIDGDSLSVHDFYVSDSTEWRSLVGYGTMNENKRFFNGDTSEAEETQTLEPISPIWFFIIFLLCFGWLWLEPRLFENQ